MVVKLYIVRASFKGEHEDFRMIFLIKYVLKLLQIYLNFLILMTVQMYVLLIYCLFYVLVSGMNHSCQPNVEVLATSSDAAHIQVRTLRALSAGELLCPSYIDLNGIFFL